MKKILLLILSAALFVCTAALLTSCGGDNPPPPVCTEHEDTDGDFACDVCGELVMPEKQDPITADITFTVKDQDGATVKGITVTVTAKAQGSSTPTVTKVSGDGGVFSATLEVGEYSVSYDYDVETVGGYYLSDTTSITVAENTTALDLLLENTTPNGTESRPYAFSVGENEITIPAGASHYYVVYRAIDLYAYITATDIKVSYNEVEYIPDADSLISIKLLGTNTNSVEKLLITNTSAEDKTYNVSISSALGTSGNPIELGTLDIEYTTAQITNEDIVYYSFTANEAGTFTLLLSTEDASASMINTRNSVSVNTDNDATEGAITLTLEAGDEVLIDFSTSISEGSVEIKFTPSFTAAE